MKKKLMSHHEFTPWSVLRATARLRGAMVDREDQEGLMNALIDAADVIWSISPFLMGDLRSHHRHLQTEVLQSFFEWERTASNVHPYNATLGDLQRIWRFEDFIIAQTSLYVDTLPTGERLDVHNVFVAALKLLSG